MNLTINQALKQAIAAHEAGRAQDAERLYRAILQSQPLHPDANHNLGVLAVSLNKTDKALPLFEAALKSNPKIEQFWVSYIDALVKVGQVKDAKKIIKKAVKKGLNAKKLDALLHQPKTSAGTKKPSREQLSSLFEHYRSGRFNSAETLAKALIHDFPQHIFAWELLGAMLHQIGRAQDSLVYLQMCAQLAPRKPEAHSNLALAYASLGNLDAAKVNYTKAIALEPDDPEMHCNFGNTLQRMRKTDEAISSYIEAIRLKPDFADAYLNLSVLYEKNNKIELALSVLKKAKEKVSDREQDFLLSEALISFRNGDFENSGNLIKKINLDVLINNYYSWPENPLLPGTFLNQHFHKIDEKIFIEEFQKNIIPTVKITQEVIKLFRIKKSGKILTTLTSFLESPTIGSSVYLSNKNYLKSLCDIWAIENKKYNITCSRSS